MARILASEANASIANPRTLRWLARSVLAVPLVAKVIGANVIIVAVAILLQAFGFHAGTRSELIAVGVAMSAASIVNFILVGIALRPVRDLQRLAQRVAAGDFTARVGPSPYADPELTRLGNMINGLLESVAQERKRIQNLGAEVVFAQDAERSRVSRELHDSIAQTLAAVRFQVAAADAEASGDLRNRLAAISGLVASALDGVKNVSYSLHSRVAEDLGLESALDALAGQVRERSGVDVIVTANVVGAPIPPNVSATFYRVAQEALRNIEMHEGAKTATVDVVALNGTIRMEIADDGRGFNPNTAGAGVSRSGLTSVKDRVMLSGGTMQIETLPNGGTRVIAELKTTRAA